MNYKNFDKDWTELTADNFDQFLKTSVEGTSSELYGGTDEVAKFQFSIKLDLKAYPTFDGVLTSWLRFKRSAMALVATYGLGEIFNEDFEVSTQAGRNKVLFESKKTPLSAPFGNLECTELIHSH